MIEEAETEDEIELAKLFDTAMFGIRDGKFDARKPAAGFQDVFFSGIDAGHPETERR